MATVDENMSEGREALESKVKQHQSATNLDGNHLYIFLHNRRGITWNLKISVAYLSTLLTLQQLQYVCVCQQCLS